MPNLIRFGLILMITISSSLSMAQYDLDDPVVKTREKRAQLQGISPDDLPPIPRVIITPPPLPSYESYFKEPYQNNNHIKFITNTKSGVQKISSMNFHKENGNLKKSPIKNNTGKQAKLTKIDKVLIKIKNSNRLDNNHKVSIKPLLPFNQESKCKHNTVNNNVKIGKKH